MNRHVVPLAILFAIFLSPRSAAAVTIDWLTVGNPGNADDSADGNIFASGVQHFGGVDYVYNIAKYDVTVRQYVEFLNSKDPNGANALGLYSANMSDVTFGGVTFNSLGLAGQKYGVIAGRGDHPANYVGWFDAVRFTNWLNNGQGNGDTETGAYTLLGGTPIPTSANGFARNPGAVVFLPSEDEWYKVAFYNPATSSYFLYATSSNALPTASGPTALPNHANWADGGPGNLTDVGAYSGTVSPYGAFDMNGNVLQWNESSIEYPYRSATGGAFVSHMDGLKSSFRDGYLQASPGVVYEGFRVASVPEPSTIALAAIGAVALLAFCRRRATVIVATCLAASFGFDDDSASHQIAWGGTIVSSNFPATFTETGLRTDMGYASVDGQWTNEMVSQRFMPSASGLLQQLAVVMNRRTIGQPLYVSICEDNSGIPGPSLGELSFDGSQFPADYFPNFPVTPLNMSSLGIQLQAGHMYDAVFRTNSALVGSWYYSSHVIPTDLSGLVFFYSRGPGKPWTTSSPGPFGFFTPLEVSIVPEPSTLILATLGGLAIFALSRRRNLVSGRQPTG